MMRRAFRNGPPASGTPVGCDAPTDKAARPETEATATVEELATAVRARDIFIATLAHELRNPLLPMTLQLSALLFQARQQGGRPGDPIAKGLERLSSLFDHYLKRTEMVLEVSRLTTGRLRLATGPVDLADLVSRVVEAQRPLARFARCEIEMEVVDAAIGQWDAAALEQVVENLLVNAIRYGEGKPIRVGVAAGDCKARLTVMDQGHGIEPEDQARIFEPFEQAVTSKETGGFGIGLWVVRQLVAAMGGTVEVDSRPGFGSTFAVSLPMDPAEMEQRAHGR